MLEELRRTPIRAHGRTTSVLNEVGFISGVSGGCFTALAYGLHGDKLFDTYPDSFLKRDVQGEIVKRTLNPLHWARLSSTGFGRSEVAAEYYDEILFHGATFGDLIGRPGPLVSATSTDISTGARFAFIQPDFDIICSDLSAVRLSRAAATSSAVPVVLSPVTFNNYGGTCSYKYPAWVATDKASSSKVEGRLHQRHLEMRSFEQSAERPFLHLVDGGVADNLGLRAVLERFRAAEVSTEFRRQLGIEQLKRTLIVVVNARSDPSTGWDHSEDGPSALALLLKSVSVPIDRNSFETLELMKDMLNRWRGTLELQGANGNIGAGGSGTPQVRLYPVVVSFDDVNDEALKKHLMALPTSFALPAADVDALRKAAGELLRASPEFAAFLRDVEERP